MIKDCGVLLARAFCPGLRLKVHAETPKAKKNPFPIHGWQIELSFLYFFYFFFLFVLHSVNVQLRPFIQKWKNGVP
jgi:hypothetical protein